MQKLYTRINWENEPSISTPLNEQNLNRMDAALNSLDDRVISQDAVKADKTELNNLVSDWSINEENGIITITKKSGEKILFDLNIEKIPVSFSLSDDGILTMVTEDGTSFTANIGAMIPVLTFADSDCIAVSVSGSGVNKTYSFSIKTGSVTQDKLNPDFLSDMQVAEANAKNYAQASKVSAKEAESYAHGGTGTREGEDTDNALYYKNQSKSEADRAKEEADRASVIVGIGIATTEKAGIVKPDGDTIEIAKDGTIRASKAGNLSALTLPYNGTDDTETTKDVVDGLQELLASEVEALDSEIMSVQYTLQEKIDGKANANGHVDVVKYATAFGKFEPNYGPTGGVVTSAAGSDTKPVYIGSDGIPRAIKYNLGDACEKNITDFVRSDMVLTTQEQIEANTDAANVAGAVALKTIIQALGTWVDLMDDFTVADSNIIIDRKKGGVFSSFLKYNPYTHQLVGNLRFENESVIDNQGPILILPQLPGIGVNKYIGQCGVIFGRNNDNTLSDKLMHVRIVENTMYASFGFDGTWHGMADSHINFIVE